MFYALTQMEEEFLQSRVNLFVALAPVVRLTHATETGMVTAAKFNKDRAIDNLIKKFDIYEFFGPSWNRDATFLEKIFPIGKIFSDEKQIESNAKYNDLESSEIF
jgi:hypothetical protein